MSKAVLFGLIGAFGGLLGGVLGYAAQAIAESGTRPAPAARPPALFSRDLQDRLDDLGAKTGDVQVSLRWYNVNDLDLHVVDPQGFEISYQKRESPSGGVLDIDRNVAEPFDERPVENIFWPDGKAPLGRYEIYVNHYKQNHGEAGPSKFLCGWLVAGNKTEVTGSVAHKEKQLVGSFEVVPPPPPPAPSIWDARGLAVAACRTGLLALTIALSLVASQNRYLRRPLFPKRHMVAFLPAVLVAGVVGGAGAQVLFGWIGGAGGSFDWGRPVAWAILGATLGGALAAFVPNLTLRRASAAGAGGGLVGAVAFEMVGRGAGNFAAVAAAAPLLGLGIGLMVALAEALFREAWLEIDYGSGEVRRVSLGHRPVTIGSGPECIVHVAGVGREVVRYVFEGGQIYRGTGGAADTPVSPGYEEWVGKVRLVAWAVATNLARPGPVPTSPTLCLPGRAPLPLSVGAVFRPGELIGCAPGPTGAVAEVVTNPKEPSAWGLKNLSPRTWSVRAPDGTVRAVEPGRSVLIRAGTEIDFGAVKGVIR